MPGPPCHDLAKRASARVESHRNVTCARPRRAALASNASGPMDQAGLDAVAVAPLAPPTDAMVVRLPRELYAFFRRLSGSAGRTPTPLGNLTLSKSKVDW
jgi:hypothetical protein